MAFPPPFPNPMMPMPQRLSQPSATSFMTGQKFGFFSPQTNPPPPMYQLPGGIPLMLRPRFQYRPRLPPPPEPPVAPPKPVTIFVGNMTDKCHDSVIQEILGRCGQVHNWKRLQDSNGKFKAFGFCDFVNPDGARRALRVLKDYPLGDKRLNVKADDATENLLKEFSAERAKVLGENAPKDEDEDNALKDAIKQIIEEQAPEMLELTPVEEEEQEESKDGGDKADEEKTPTASHKRKRSRSSSHSSRRRKRSSSRTSKDKHSKRSSKKTRHRSSSASSAVSSASSVRSRKSKEKSKKKSRKRSSSAEDSDVQEEKRRLKKELKQREESYQERLKKWEDRERRRAKQYAKDEESEVQRQKTIAKEAKKLRQFLEDYVDERDDPKFYKGSALFDRRRNYEREREADTKDRHEERKELEEFKKMLLKEKREEAEKTGGRVIKKEEVEEEEARDATYWASVDEKQQKNGIVKAEVVDDSAASPATPQPVAPLHAPPEMGMDGAKESPTPTGAQKKIVTTIQQKTISAPVNGVFEDEEEEEDTLHQIKKKIKPFEITREDRIHSLTPEERKKLIKDLIARIPMDREQLFEFPVCWDYLDEQLMEQRVRPWINKKISEYIGEEEPSLVAFICEKISSRSTPNETLQDLSMVLDEEADVFMVKLWRLIVYESEAKRLGLNVLPSSGSDSHNK